MDTSASWPAIDASAQPWLEVIEGDGRAGPSPLAARPARALFAARVRPKPFDERRSYGWGWSPENVRQEAAARQQQFLAGLHDEAQFSVRRVLAGPTVALHAWRDADRGGLALSLLGGVDGLDGDDARARALDLWHTVEATFPYDYDVTPLTSSVEFQSLSGLGVLAGLSAPGEVVEIRRFETRLPTERGVRLLLGVWQGDDRADEPVWRALAAAPEGALLSIRLRPTRLTTGEWSRLEGVVARSPTDDAGLWPHAFDWAADLYDRRQRAWGLPFLLQVHVAAPGGVALYLRRVLGGAFTHRAGAPAQPGYEALWPPDAAGAAAWQAALGRVGFTATPGGEASLWPRLHLLADMDEALTVFRWPYPPSSGLPGVTFL